VDTHKHEYGGCKRVLVLELVVELLGPASQNRVVHNELVRRDAPSRTSKHTPSGDGAQLHAAPRPPRCIHAGPLTSRGSMRARWVVRALGCDHIPGHDIRKACAEQGLGGTQREVAQLRQARGEGRRTMGPV
jgi:hypothetical protein